MPAEAWLSAYDVPDQCVSECGRAPSLRLDAEGEAGDVDLVVRADFGALLARDFAPGDEGRVAALGREPVAACVVAL
jgi:hypothetical protein